MADVMAITRCITIRPVKTESRFGVPSPLSESRGASPGVFVSPLLIFCFRNYRRNWHAVARRIDGDKCQVCGADMTFLLGTIIFDPDFHAHFHRGMKGSVHRGAQDAKIADPHRYQKIQVVNRCCHHPLARVPVSGQRAREVDPVHQASAKKSIQRIGIVRQNDFGHFRDRVVNRPRS